VNDIVLPPGTKLPRKLKTEVLIKAIETFMAINPAYAFQDGADDCCFEASAEFVGHLDEIAGMPMNVEVRMMFFCNQRPDGHGCSEGDENRRSLHIFDDFPLVKKIDFADYLNHTVVLIGNLHIDFTARQFDPDASWPLMWIKQPATARSDASACVELDNSAPL
jgi:hypothetical protein